MDCEFERERRLHVGTAWTFHIHDTEAEADRVGGFAVICA